jgi:AraC family transcriptional regulator
LRIESPWCCDLLESLYGGWGGKFLAKIAVELERAVAQRAATGEPGSMTSRLLGQGDGWHVADVVCTCGPQDRRFEEQHPFFTIAVVVAGTFQYRGSLNGPGLAEELMTPGSLLLGNAGQSFECGHEHGLGDRCLSFRYSRDYFERVAADAGISPSQRNFPRLSLPPLEHLSPVIAGACADLVRASQSRWEELSVRLAAETVKRVHSLSASVSTVPPSTVARVTRTVRMIERQADSELPLGSLAREAGLSPYHFLRAFARLTGVTPHQYVRRMRLREAAVRLVSEKEKVLDVALDCGFGDVSNFNRAFRNEFGANPRSWKASLDRLEAAPVR